jgi:hypothetical protein
MSAANINARRQLKPASTILAAKTTLTIHVSPVALIVFEVYQGLKGNIGLTEREILMLVHI